MPGYNRDRWETNALMSIQTAIHVPVDAHSQRWHVTWSKLIPVIIIAAGLCAFANSFRGVFVLDDNDHILHDDTIRGLFPLNQHLFLPDDRRWISRLTFIANYALRPQEVLNTNVKPIGFHAVNLAIHIIAALTLYGLVRRTLWLPRFGRRFAESGSWIAMACALFWMLHPLQTQSVTYIVQREESLMGMFFLLTLYGVVRGASAAKGSWGWYTLAVIACFLGMGTKEVMVVAPLVVLLYDWTFLTPSGLKNPVRRGWLYVALFLCYASFIKLGTGDIFNGKGNAGFNIPVGYGYQLAYAFSPTRSHPPLPAPVFLARPTESGLHAGLEAVGIFTISVRAPPSPRGSTLMCCGKRFFRLGS